MRIVFVHVPSAVRAPGASASDGREAVVVLEQGFAGVANCQIAVATIDAITETSL